MKTEEVELEISRMIHETIETRTPYLHVPTEEPFLNRYGTVSYDYSGEVREMELNDLEEIVADLGLNPGSMMYSSKLEELLNSIYINRWEATYTSNYGKHWISYWDLIEEEFREWKYENFNLYDDEGKEINEELESELDEIFYDFFKDTSLEMYLQKLKLSFELVD